MAYEPTTWKDGDIVTAEKLNKIEEGVANAGSSGGGSLTTFVNTTTMALDKTWQEINDALASGTNVNAVLNESTGTTVVLITTTNSLGGVEYIISGITILPGPNVESAEFVTDSANGYPVARPVQGDSGGGQI